MHTSSRRFSSSTTDRASRRRRRETSGDDDTPTHQGEHLDGSHLRPRSRRGRIGTSRAAPTINDGKSEAAQWVMERFFIPASTGILSQVPLRDLKRSAPPASSLPRPRRGARISPKRASHQSRSRGVPLGLLTPSSIPCVPAAPPPPRTSPSPSPRRPLRRPPPPFACTFPPRVPPPPARPRPPRDHRERP